jgi:enterochelin esterase-like enzyme
VHRYTLDDATVLSVQEPASPRTSGTSTLAMLFDGRPMIDEGIPETVRSLQDAGVIGPLTTVYVESIEGSTTRGPTRVASLTDPAMLGRFIDSLQRFLEEPVTGTSGRGVVLGHSLGGNAALHVACRWPDLFGAVATGSAALWWPGDEVQLSGSQVVDDVLASTGLRIWMGAGVNEGPDLLRRNRDLWERADAAGLDLAHREHPGGHELSAWRSGLEQALQHLLPRHRPRLS